MTIRAILKTAEKFVTDNSPGILTGLAVAGTVSTAVLAAKAAFNSAGYLETNDPDANYDLKESAKEVWRFYIPTVMSGAATITCIVAANRIGARRTAAIAAAFQLSEKLAEEYKDRVVQTLGKQKEEKMRSELAADRMNRTPGADQIIIVGPETLFLDEMSGRFFKHEVEKVRKAVNDINFKINNDFYASLSEFYDLIGLDRTTFSDDVGWNADSQLDVTYTPTIIKDGRAAIAISFMTQPIRGFDRLQ